MPMKEHYCTFVDFAQNVDRNVNFSGLKKPDFNIQKAEAQKDPDIKARARKSQKIPDTVHL